MLCNLASGCFFLAQVKHGGGGPALDRDKFPCKRLFCNPQPPWEGSTAKSVTEKNNSRVDCAEAGKKTVQALCFDRLIELTRKGEDFCLPLILSCGVARKNLSGEV